MGLGAVSSAWNWGPPIVAGTVATYKAFQNKNKKRDRPQYVYPPNPFVRRKFVPESEPGNYRGKFVSNGKFSKERIPYCLTSIVESHSTQTSSDLVFIGCGLNYERVALGICQMIIHCLFSKLGKIQFKDWDLLLGTTYRLDYNYRIALNSANTINRQITLSGSDTYKGAAEKLLNDMRSSFAEEQFHKFENFVLFAKNNTQPEHLALLNPNGLRLKCSVSNNLLMQNRTKSGNSTDPDTGEERTNVIDANPCYGRVYSRNGNAFIPINSNIATATGYKAFGTWDDSSFSIDVNVNFPKATGNEFNSNSDLFVGAKPTKSMVFEPGNIWNLSNSFSFSGTFHKFISQNMEFLKEPTPEFDLKSHGHVAMIGIEKMLEVSLTENPITIGYENNETFKMGYKYKDHHKMVPLFEQTY